ncbi:cytochrome P450 [Mycobacteroides abscessus subsp. abscessus]|nr:cytochrome P450 [Mycobacteroides abscessus subsp. abscessus]
MTDDRLTRPAINLPPSPRLPSALRTLGYLTVARPMMQRFHARYGTAFSMHIPGFGPGVVISDPALIKELFGYSADAVEGVEPNLSVIIGPGSTFGLQGAEHQRRRKLLVAAFRMQRMRSYTGLLEEETLAASASWPEGEEFPVLPTMLTIGLNAILRAVFGASGDELDTLRVLVPETIDAGSPLAMLPWLRRDFGRWSPWHRYIKRREELYVVLDELITEAQKAPDLSSRQDVLALLLRSVDEDGAAMSRREIAEELLTFVGAGHETTATAVSWTIERLRRHPEVLARLAAEVDSGSERYLDATIQEVLRVRPPVESVARYVAAPSISLGPWVIPQGYTVVASAALSHQDNALFDDAQKFDPDRFIEHNPDPYAWIPFGGGGRRCPGAAFAHLEVAVIMRTLLREFDIEPSRAPAERRKNRGIVHVPGSGGLIAVHRRRQVAAWGRLEQSS